MIPMMARRGWFQLSIEGIEATQATQFYRSARHLDRKTAEHDGAVPLVAGKALALRVYPDVRAPEGQDGHALVSGEVWCRRSRSGTHWRAASRLNGPVPGRAARWIDRGDPRQTLNFRLSGNHARGELA